MNVPWRMARLALICLLVFVAQGCASLGTYQSSRTLEKGKIEFDLRPQVIGGVVDGAGAGLPALDLAVRYGINGKADFGARLGTSGLNFDLKFQLVRNERLGLALGPSIGGVYAAAGDAGIGVFDLGVPVIFGLFLGPSTELVLAPKVVYRRLFASGGGESASVNIIMPGLSIGLTQEFSKSFRIRPEFSILVPVGNADSSLSDSPVGFGTGGLAFNVGIGIAFGGGYENGLK